MLRYGISKYYLYHYSCAYYNESDPDKKLTMLSDGGGTNHINIMNAINKYGIIPTRSWEYSLAKQKRYFTYDPTLITNQILLDIDTTDIEWAKHFTKSIQIKNLIQSTNNQPTIDYVQLFKSYLDKSIPIIFSIDISGGFDSKYMLNVSETKSETKSKNNSYHSMVIIGYDDQKEIFKLRNSWGAYSGDSGYYYISYKTIKQTNIDNSIIIDAFIINQFTLI